MKTDKYKKCESDKNLEEKNEFNVEDTTKYGEFVSSYFAWVPLEKQKEKTFIKFDNIFGKN